MSVPKILLLSCTLPGAQGVGGIILHDLCSFYPHNSICCYAVLGEGWSSILPDDLRWMPLKVGSAKFEQLPSSKFGKPGKMLKWIKNRCQFNSHIKGLTEEAVEFGKTNNIEKVWAVLDAPTSIELVLKVSKSLKVPLLSLVWDDVRHLATSLYLDRLTANYMAKTFSDTVKVSERCAVIGESMKEEYERQYGTPGIILRHGVQKKLVKKPSFGPSERDTFVIGFAGTVNAPDAFKSLLKALSSVNWKIGTRQIELRLLGPRFDLWLDKPSCVEVLGWRSLEDTIHLLSEVDITYLPQPFNSNFSEMAKLSFPTKLTTYLAAGRPVFLHSPEGASLPRFFDRFPAGIWCNSVDSNLIIKKLESILTDKDLYAQAVKEGQKALEEEFSEEIFRERFAKFIGIDKEQLIREQS